MHTARRRWSPRPVALILVAGVSCCWPTDAHAQTVIGGIIGSGVTAATSFRGQAVAVSGFALGSSLTLVNSGALAVSGGAQEASAEGESVAGVFSAEALHTATIGETSAASSEASAANISVVGSSGFFVFSGGLITADFVMSRATATCSAIGATATGVSEVDGVVIDGQAIAVTGAANQIVMVDGNLVIINEQVVTETATTADVVVVNALHIVTSTGVNLVFGSSSAGITCGVPSPQCGDFVTGGGWITGTPSGAKANFGVAGGIRNGAFWGHLNYVDHGNGMHVKATAVTGYQQDPNDADCRIIDYAVVIDDQPGTARVRVCDEGEPGRNDIFEIQLSNGYFAGGDLGGSRPGGGNIQLHECR